MPYSSYCYCYRYGDGDGDRLSKCGLQTRNVREGVEDERSTLLRPLSNSKMVCKHTKGETATFFWSPIVFKVRYDTT
jgi:hypothetical protein